MGVLITYKDIIKNMNINLQQELKACQGNLTTVTSNKLTDINATFETDEVLKKYIVLNVTQSKISYVSNIDSETVLTLADDIFDTLNDKYFIFKYSEMTVDNIEYFIEFTEQYIFDRLRNKYSEPETNLLTQKTVKFITIEMTICKVGMVLYSYFSIPIEQLKARCENAENLIQDILDGKILLDVTYTNQQVKNQTGKLTGGRICKTVDFEENYTENEYWTPLFDNKGQPNYDGDFNVW